MSQRLLRALVEGRVRGLGVKEIAKGLGIGQATLESLVGAYDEQEGEGAFERVIAERKAQLEVVGADWDELEAVSVERLAALAREGRITAVSDLLAIARVANMAARRGGFSKPPAEQGNGIRAGAVLRAGETLELRLTATVARQIEQGGSPGREIEGEYERLDSPLELRQLADGVEAA